MLTLEEALRATQGVSRINLFRNKARGGWEAAVARGDNVSQFAVGAGVDPVEALLRALKADAAGRKTAPVQPEPRSSLAADFSGGIFG